MSDKVIEIEKLTKMYGKHRGITDVSFSVEKGEIFGFIGPNGAGKTTTLRILVGLIFPTSGSARVFGRDVVTEGHDIRAEVGYLPSEVFYYENMKVEELLNYSASFFKKDSARRIEELAKRLELDLSRKIDELSYGNKKKVGIIQGLLHSPDLIILDEPTSGLDPLMQREFFDIIREENERGASVLFSSHILSEVQRLCHRLAIIKEGSIIKIDQVSALREEAYKKFKITADGLSEAELPMAEINDFQHRGNEISFLYRGDVNKILQALAAHHIQDIQIEEPDLEEIFMHYYE